MRFNPIREFFDSLLRRIPTWARVVAGVAGSILLVILLVLIFRPKYDPLKDPLMKPILDREILRVAVADNVTSFSFEDDNGTFSGFEDDMARAIAKRIFGDNYLIDFTPVTTSTRLARLELGDVDCSISLIPTNMNSKFAYSTPYYENAVVVIVNSKSTYNSIDQLNNATIGVLTYPPVNASSKFTSSPSSALNNEGAASALMRFKINGNYEFTIRRFSSLPDMLSALNHDQIQGIALENAILREHYDDATMRILPEGIGTVSYSVAVSASNPALLEVVNQTIADMNQTGELNALLDKWGLTSYGQK